MVLEHHLYKTILLIWYWNS